MKGSCLKIVTSSITAYIDETSQCAEKPVLAVYTFSNDVQISIVISIS